MPSSLITVVGPNDSCIFEYYKSTDNNSLNLTHQLALYESLDRIEDVMWSKPEYGLMSVDRPFNDAYVVSAFIGLTPMKIVLMQDIEPRESTKKFFNDLYQLCCRRFLNPFSKMTNQVTNQSFRK